MSTAQAVLEQLENALGTGYVPDEEKRRGAQLLARLQSPVQVVLIGVEGVGKSRLINMLVDMSVIPEAIDLPPLEIVYGPKPRTVYLMADGSEQALDGLHLDHPSPPDTAILRAELPLPVLTGMSLTELSPTGSPADQKAIADWAIRRADIVLWCSQTFDAREQALWSAAPEALKDHSFLVLTKADQLQMKSVLADRIAQLEGIVAEEFYRMYPVATIQAISSIGAGGVRDEDTWVSSGGKALADAVRRLVETGRSAAADNALVFLKRHVPASNAMTETGAKPRPKPAQDRTRPAASKDQNDAGQTIKEALAFLQERADVMLNAAQEDRPDKQEFVLDHCLETANKLSDLMMEVDPMNTSLSAIQEDIMECSDMMVLFHLEKTEDATADAVTLLLQLKKEMSVAAAS